MKTSVGQSTQYKGYTVKRYSYSLHVVANIGEYVIHGDFSTAKVIHKTISEITSTKFHPVALRELFEAKLEVVEQLTQLRKLNWSKHTKIRTMHIKAKDGIVSDTARDMLGTIEKQDEQLEAEILQAKRIALFVHQILTALDAEG